MAFELVYTSVPRGLRPGSSGFCIVAYTNGLAANIALQLEGLSAYKPYFPHYDANAAKNPVAYSHYRYQSSGETVHFFGRVCFYGLDYTKRSNKLAHHIVMRKSEKKNAPAGPASVFRQEELFRSEWTEEPQLFRTQLTIDAPDQALRKASTWEAYTGDAGWAGVLVQHYLDVPDKPIFVIFDPLVHPDTLSLVEEALLLLPPETRWNVSFNTYFMTLPAGIRCSWRFCVPGSEALKEARRTPGVLVLDLTKKMPPAPAGKFQNIARTGIRPEMPTAQSQPQNRMTMPALQSPGKNSAGIRTGENSVPPIIPINPKEAAEYPKSHQKAGGFPFKYKVGCLLTLLLVIAAAGGSAYVIFQLKKQLGPSTPEVPPPAAHTVPDSDAASAPLRNRNTAHDEKNYPAGEEIIRQTVLPVPKEKITEPAPPKTVRKAESAENKKKTVKVEAKKSKDLQEMLRKKKIVEKCRTIWLNYDPGTLTRKGGCFEEELLLPGETVVSLTIGGKHYEIENGRVEESRMTGMNSKLVFRYEINISPRFRITNISDKDTANYPFDGFETSQKRKVSMRYVRGESRILSGGQLVITAKDHKIRLDYQLDSNDNNAMRKTDKLFQEAWIVFKKNNRKFAMSQKVKLSGQTLSCTLDHPSGEYKQAMKKLRKTEQQKAARDEIESRHTDIYESCTVLYNKSKEEAYKKQYRKIQSFLDEVNALKTSDGVLAVLEKLPLKQTLNETEHKKLIKHFNPDDPLPKKKALEDELKSLDSYLKKEETDLIALLKTQEAWIVLPPDHELKKIGEIK